MPASARRLRCLETLAWPAPVASTSAVTVFSPSRNSLSSRRRIGSASIRNRAAISSSAAPAELRSLLAQTDRLQLVDMREHAEFAGGHIPGARLLPLGELHRRAAELDSSRPVVCVCRSGKRSSQAIEKLAALGFDEVRQLDGGFTAWEQAGFPLEKDKGAPWALERQVRLAAGLLVLAGLGLSLVWPPAIGLSWFVAT